MPSRRATAVSGRGLLIGVVLVGAFLTARLLSPPQAFAAIDGALGDGITLALSVIIESLPFVFLGIGFSIIVQVWLPEGFLLRRLPRRSLPRRLVLSVLGVLLPVCECGNVPLARGFLMSGLTVGESMTFLLAAPILNPVTIITTYEAFGWEDGVLVSRILGGFLIANLVGIIYSRMPRPMSALTPVFERSCSVDHSHAPRGKRLTRSAELFAHETTAMLPSLFVGAAIAGLIQVAVSRDVLVTLGSNPLWSVVALMALAFVVSICSNVDAFFVLALGSTFMPGAIVAFLVFGPMIDIKMLAMLRTTFRARTLALVTALVALSTLVLGLAVNLLV
ncbi:hypothetical protein CLV46_3068 [Diaminobutyricimonas aerilata]|uniref:Permease n=1 Tax=Diaminobutyricimonas aerilata TaxID=1162967 RepID=A0A2M9CNJ6_9MICO|nr:permease [Diaminobutyricimonas aerilata]PJJ73476.1 hypothetical protein CLV46_3068 [Diaminobutyricimonas aerilata]